MNDRIFKRGFFDRLKSKFNPKPIDLKVFGESMLSELDACFGDTIEMSRWLRNIESWGEMHKRIFPHYQHHNEFWLKDVCVGASLYFMSQRRILTEAESRIDKAIINCIPKALEKADVSSPLVRIAYESCKTCLDCNELYAIMAGMIKYWFVEMAFNDTPPKREMMLLNDTTRYDEFNKQFLDGVFLRVDEECERELKYWND